MNTKKDDLNSAPSAPPMLYAKTEPSAPAYPHSGLSMFQQTTVPNAKKLDKGDFVTAPVMIAVKRDHDITINSYHSLNVVCIGDSDCKQQFIETIQEPNQPLQTEYITSKSYFAKYRIWSLTQNTDPLHSAYLKNSHIILLFGQECIQENIQQIPIELREKFNFYVYKGNECFMPINNGDLSNLTSNQIQTYQTNTLNDNLLDSIGKNLMKSTWQVVGQPFEDDQPSYLWALLTWLLTVITDLFKGLMHEPEASTASNNNHFL